MTIEEQAQQLQNSLIQLQRMKKKPSLSADEKRAVVEDIRHRLRTAEATLNLPARPDDAYGRHKLILWTERATGTLKTEYP
jgi:hypothetical protein